jgi:predicted transcriptional regulator
LENEFITAQSRQDEIHSKGFNMSTRDLIPSENGAVDYSKIKVGIKSLDDAIISLGDFKKINPTLSDKTTIQRAIADNDLDSLREISDFFYRISGIYSRLCKHMANFYRYDWLLTPHAVKTGGQKK